MEQIARLEPLIRDLNSSEMIDKVSPKERLKLYVSMIGLYTNIMELTRKVFVYFPKVSEGVTDEEMIEVLEKRGYRVTRISDE